MWYFSWILGLGLALTLGVLNALWFEMTETHKQLLELEQSAGKGGPVRGH